MTRTHIRAYKLMNFFIILCLYSQFCIEFFLVVFGLVLVLQYLHSHVRRPPPRHPPHHHLLGYHGAAFLRCALLVVKSTTSRSFLIVLALSVSLHRSNIVFASDLTATNSFHLFTRDKKEWKMKQRQLTPLGLLQLELARERRVLYSEAHQERVVADMRQDSADVGVAGTITHEHILRNRP